MRASGDHGDIAAGGGEFCGQVAADRAGAENADSQGISPFGETTLLYWLFFAGSLDELEDEPELDGVDDEPELDGLLLEDEPEPDAPEPLLDDESLDDGVLELDDGELELDDGVLELDDGVLELDDGVLELDDPLPELDGGVALLPEPELDGELVEPDDDEEPLLDGDEGDVELELGLLDDEPLDDAPLEPLPLEPPRSQPASAAPSAMDTTTAIVESFMLPP
jgi:hypothetical protein